MLVDRRARIVVGDVVALRDPREENRVIVKRVAGIEAHGFRVEGDNESESTDSRHFGPVRSDLVVGRVVRRYWPAPRRARERSSQTRARTGR